jgi:pyruvate ferredoxin oxidoreductase alpha subunit
MSDQQQSTTQAFLISDQQPQQKSQTFVKKTAAQRELYESGNELAAYAAKQINYHIMGYYPITPSTQIAENLDLSGARGEHNIRLIAAEGEHSAAGICYGASAGGGRVFNATSANGLLYALEQFPVQSGTRMPMVMNVACRTVSGPLCIKGDHSDIMYLLNTGWIILFADDPQMVYDFNLIALKLAEKVNLPVAVAFDGFFTSHQKQKCMVFSDNETVQNFIGKKLSCDNPDISSFAGNDSTGENHFFSVLDLNHPISVGSYMNEPDIINNKYQLSLAMEETRKKLPVLFDEFASLSGRMYTFCRGYRYEDADIILFLLGSSFHTATVAADTLRKEGIRAGVITLNVLRPFPADELRKLCMHAQTIIAADRQDSYGAGGGNMSLELRAALQDTTDSAHPIRVLTRIYGLGGKDFFVEDAVSLFREGLSSDAKSFDYYGITPGKTGNPQPQYFAPLTKERQSPGVTACTFDPETGKMIVKGGLIKDATAMPKRIAPGIGTPDAASR